METYKVWEGHMDALHKKIKRIENKCKKFGCDFHYAEVGEEFCEIEIPKTWDDEAKKPKTMMARFVIIEAEGTALLNDWEVVAFVERTEKGNLYSKLNMDIEIPTRYRDSDCYCEHCNTKRRRKSVCIVRNIETNEFKQVGMNCLCDFTHGLSASAVTSWMEARNIFEEAQEASLEGCGGWGVTYYDTEEMLRYSAETIRHFGYKKSDSDYPTRKEMMDMYNLEHGEYKTDYYADREYIRWVEHLKEKHEKVHFSADSEEASQMANDALEWIEAQEASNDYMHNLKVVTSLRYVDANKMGILVSLFPTWNRDLERQARKAEKEAQRQREIEEGARSDYVGEVGKRIAINVASCKVITSWTNSYDGYNYTTTYMYRFVDEEGNIFIWKTQKSFDEDCVMQLVGTVKEHSEFREIKQTVLTRCKVTLKEGRADTTDDAMESLDELYA